MVLVVLREALSKLYDDDQGEGKGVKLSVSDISVRLVNGRVVGTEFLLNRSGVSHSNFVCLRNRWLLLGRAAGDGYYEMDTWGNGVWV